jgi:hypothetical protein
MQTVFPTAYCTADALEDISAYHHTNIRHHIRASSCQVKQAISHGCSHGRRKSFGIMKSIIEQHGTTFHLTYDMGIQTQGL